MSRIHYDWSKLYPDLLRSILESLNTKDFHRARIVCSNWYTVSTTSKRPLYPWRILFKTHSISLYDPGEDKTHEIEHPDIDFSKTCVMASCSNWLLIVDSLLNFYLLNVFTRERINLPSMVSSLLGQERFERSDEWEQFIKRTDIVSSKKTAVLWVNERTGDYVVAWGYKQHFLFSYKKGDDSWWNHKGTITKCLDMAYKDDKLYVLTFDDYIKILDLSDKEVVEGNLYCDHRFRFVSQLGEHVWTKRLAVTNSGEVLIVLSLKGSGEKRLFSIFKMNLETSHWERVDSLGGEMLIFGRGVTIRAPVREIDGGGGIKGDSICFLDVDLWPPRNFLNTNRQVKFGVFDLATSTTTWPKPLDGLFLKSLVWFVPGCA